MEHLTAMYTITCSPRDIVSSLSTAARIAWLEKFGIPSQACVVTLTAPLATWADAGATINADATITVERYCPLHDAIRQMIADRIVAQGASEPIEFPPSFFADFVASEAAKAAEKRARALAEEAERVAARAARAAYEAAQDAERARKAAKAAELEVRKAAALPALLAYAARFEHLTRSIAEGYDVTSATLDAIANEFVSELQWPTDLVSVDSLAWAEVTDRKAPNDAAFTLLDRVKAMADASDLPTAIGEWTVSRILRIDVCPHEGSHHYVTAVCATLETPWGVREITASTESQACQHE